MLFFSIFSLCLHDGHSMLGHLRNWWSVAPRTGVWLPGCRRIQKLQGFCCPKNSLRRDSWGQSIGVLCQMFWTWTDHGWSLLGKMDSYIPISWTLWRWRWRERERYIIIYICIYIYLLYISIYTSYHTSPRVTSPHLTMLCFAMAFVARWTSHATPSPMAKVL